MKANMKYLTVLGGAMILSACAAAKQDQAEMYGASIGIVNHTDKYIYATQVGNNGGGHAGRYRAGVGSVCCVMLPVTWHAGLRFNVHWDVPEGTKHIWKEKLVDVERYDEPGSLYLHIFPNDEVRIVVTKWAGGSQKHPIQPPVKTPVQ
ncbi:hypothetical protein GCM10007387_58400 [Pseudoduganella albidiflava]|uniref:DUF3304 domain-containing protein n=2 Tax=Pseudoduganella albidiflava TaxID=321983 RepID=A0A411X1F1_9BURK|nr:DUF3304 domain-containing protein [Pseudoduganella albidiflava]GGY68614.1 hypothetical protein GCM10007387_58400 [Pseudoduganella albidiflava]